jgi:Family of unknown function (DUF6345)
MRHSRLTAACHRHSNLTCKLVAVLTGALGLTAISFSSHANDIPHSPMHIGVRCQDDFQNNYDATIDAYSMCGNFINTIRRTDWIDFYFNLHGANVAFSNGNPVETCNPCGGADSVDFFLMYTHGGIDPSQSRWAMWDFQTRAWSGSMRFGQAGQQLKVFATYSCDTLETSDGHFWDRMGAAFSGGVKLMLGAHDLLYDGDAQKGTEFASRMQNGESIGNAWLESVWYANNDNHPSVAATGADANDCWNRIGMNVASVQTTPALRDGQIGYVCWAGWNGS